MFSFRNLYVRLPLYILYFGREKKKREKETVGVLCYVCTEYVHTNTLYSVSSGFCLVYLQKAETESMAITSMAGGPIPSQKALFGKRNKVHTVWTIVLFGKEINNVHTVWTINDII